MTTIELYRKHKAGEIGRDRFIYEVRRDKNLPWVTNITSYDDAVKILKNKGIISEAEIAENFEVHFSDGIRQAKKFKDIKSAIRFAKDLIATNKNLQHVDVFKGGISSTADPKGLISWWGPGSYFDNMSKKDPSIASKQMALNEADANVATDPAVDKVNPYFLKRGVNMLLSKEKELTNDSYIDALNKAAKALEKDPSAYNEEMFANAKDVEKADKKLQMKDVKKGDLNDTDNEMKKVKVKALKKAALKELADSLKKKDNINEDAHWNHTVGSNVHTPDGEGTVKEIIGGTLTVEFEDGRLADYQINTIDHHTKKAQEEASMNFADEPANPKYNVKKDISGRLVQATNDEGVTFSMNDEAITRDTNKRIKITGFEETQGKVMALYNTGMFFSSIDIDGLEKPKDMRFSHPFGGSTVTEKIKEYMEKFKGDKEKMGKLKEMVKKLKEATKYHAGGEIIFKKDSEAPGFEADLKSAGVKFTKEKVSS